MKRHRDGKTYISPELTALLCDTTTVSLRNWRAQENPPPYNVELDMYPAQELGLWIRKEMIFKRGRGGSYPNLPDLSRIPPHLVTVTSSTPTTKSDAEIRLKTLQADKVEIELKQMAGELVPLEEVAGALSSMVSRIKTKLLRLPSALAPMIAGMTDTHEVQKHMERGVREALEELSQDWDEVKSGEVTAEDEADEPRRMPGV